MTELEQVRNALIETRRSYTETTECDRFKVKGKPKPTIVISAKPKCKDDKMARHWCFNEFGNCIYTLPNFQEAALTRKHNQVVLRKLHNEGVEMTEEQLIKTRRSAWRKIQKSLDEKGIPYPKGEAEFLQWMQEVMRPVSSED